jgi:putative oxidoreductase
MAHPEFVAYAALILRLSLAALFFAHAWLKIAVFTPAGSVKYFQALGLPGYFAYVTITGELAIGAGLFLGVLTRLAALAGIPLVAGTIVMVHGSKGWLFANEGGGWEFPAFWTVALAVQALLGGGAWALGPALGIDW